MEEFEFGFPRVKSVERIWEEIKSNLKLWGFVLEDTSGMAKVKRCRDGKVVTMLWMELYDCGQEREDLEEYFNEE